MKRGFIRCFVRVLVIQPSYEYPHGQVVISIPRWNEHELVVRPLGSFSDKDRPLVVEGATLIATVNADVINSDDLIISDLEEVHPDDRV